VYHGEVGFVYRLPSLELVRNFSYATVTGMGWGLAYDAAKHEVGADIPARCEANQQT
jgi:glutamine cyclotransferase